MPNSHQTPSSANDQGLTHDENARKFILRMNPRDAFVDYYWQDNQMILTHIEVAPELRGTGIGARFAKDVFKEVENAPHDVRVTCPFMRKVAATNPVWRKKFNL